MHDIFKWFIMGIAGEPHIDKSDMYYYRFLIYDFNGCLFTYSLWNRNVEGDNDRFNLVPNSFIGEDFSVLFSCRFSDPTVERGYDLHTKIEPHCFFMGDTDKFEIIYSKIKEKVGFKS